MISKKKGWIIGLGLVVALGGTSAVVAAEAAGSYIGKTKAKQIALKEVPGTVTDIELERKRDIVYYEVDIDRTDSYQEVDVHVDAYTGKVLRVVNDDDDAPRGISATAPAASAVATAAPSTVSAPAASSAPALATQPTLSPSATAVPTASPAASSSNAKPSAAQPSPTAAPSGTSSAAAKAITKEQAAKLAQEAVKGGEVIRVSTDRDDGILEYEVKLKLARGYAEVEIAAATGKVLDIDYDDFDDDDDYDDDDFDDDDYYDDDDYDDRHDDDRHRG